MYREAIERDPKRADAHNNLGLLLKRARKDFDQAEAMFRKAIELDPKDPIYHWNLSLLLEERAKSSDGASSSSWARFTLTSRDDMQDAIHETREYTRLGGQPGLAVARLAKLLAAPS